MEGNVSVLECGQAGVKLAAEMMLATMSKDLLRQRAEIIGIIVN